MLRKRSRDCVRSVADRCLASNVVVAANMLDYTHHHEFWAIHCARGQADITKRPESGVTKHAEKAK
jgi:hypothetical protein